MREVVEEVRAGGRREERVVALLTKLVDKAEAPPSTSAQQLTEEERLAPLSGVTIMVAGGLEWRRRGILGTGRAVMECMYSPCPLVVKALPRDTTLPRPSSPPLSHRCVSPPPVSWAAAENAESGHSPLIGVHWAGGVAGGLRRVVRDCRGLPVAGGVEPGVS